MTWLNLLSKLMGTLLIALLLSKWLTRAKVPRVKAKWHIFLQITLSRQQDYWHCSSRRSEFNCRSVHVTLVANKVAPVQVLLRHFSIPCRRHSARCLPSPFQRRRHTICPNCQTLQCHPSPVQPDVPFRATACSVAQTSTVCGSKGHFCSALASMVHLKECFIQ